MSDNTTALPEEFAYLTEIGDLINPCPDFPRKVVYAPRRWMEPYFRLERQELGYRLEACQKHQEGFALWLRQVAQFAGAFSRSYDLPAGDDEHLTDLRQAIVFRLDLLGLASGNSKLALDAALAGYYSACMAIERHLVETWRRVAHSRLLPAEVWRWYPENMWAEHAKAKTNKELPREHPNAKHIAGAIEAYGGDGDKRYLEVVRDGFEILTDHSHPTVEGASQTWTEIEGKRVFGPSFSDEHCRRCLTWGLTGGMLLLTELSLLGPQSSGWNSETESISNGVGDWLKRCQS